MYVRFASTVHYVTESVPGSIVNKRKPFSEAFRCVCTRNHGRKNWDMKMVLNNHTHAIVDILK